MQAHEAVAQIRNTVFKSGWKFSARTSPYGPDDEIVVMFTLDTVDTSYPDADGICRVPKALSDIVILDVSGMDEAALCYRLLEIVREMDEHENREFLQVRRPDGSWYAPLHPHTDDGNRKWDQLSAKRGTFTGMSQDEALSALLAVLR